MNPDNCRRKADHDSRRAVLLSFWHGLLAPSGLALAITLAVSVIVAGGIATVVTPAFLAGPWGAYLPRSTNDTEAFATREALRLAVNGSGNGIAKRLVLISDSILAQTLASDTAMAEMLDDLTGELWQVAFLTSPLQDPLDQMTLADFATRSQPGVIVFPLGYEKFAATAAGINQFYQIGRLGLRSDWADHAVLDLGGHSRPKTGVYVIDNSSFVLRNATVMALRALTGKRAPRMIAAYSQSEKLSPDAFAKLRLAFQAYLRAATSGSNLVFDLLAETVRHLRERHSIVILAEEPVNPDMLSSKAEVEDYERYRARAALFAKSLGVFYCDLPATVTVTQADFSDLLHIVGSTTQDRFRVALGRCVVEALASQNKSF